MQVELEYPDGGIPTDAILSQFLRLCEREMAVGGAVAAHCAAGLGRTGTHMAAWVMRDAGFSAREAIAWCRICRPGSVVGQQQHFLVAKQRQLGVKAVITDAEVIAMDTVRVKARRRPVTMGSEVITSDGGRSLRPVVAHAKASRHRQQQKRPPLTAQVDRRLSIPTWSSYPVRARHGSVG